MKDRPSAKQSSNYVNSGLEITDDDYHRTSTIQIDIRNKKRIKRYGKFGEHYNDTMTRILDALEVSGVT